MLRETIAKVELCHFFALARGGGLSTTPLTISHFQRRDGDDFNTENDVTMVSR